MLAAVVILFITLYIGYVLFIKGWAWAGILIVGGFVCGRLGILHYLPATKNTIITVSTYQISWASALAAIVVILGIGVLTGISDD